MFEMIQEPDYGAISRTMVHIVIPGEPSSDSKNGLSERGENQVFELAHSRLLAGPDKIYSSGAKECRSTAEILAKELYTTTSKMDCLKEIDLGISEIDDTFLQEEMPALWEDMDVEPKKGESLRQAQQRISQCIDRLTKAHPNATIAVVLSPIVSVIFHTLIVGGIPQMNEWLNVGFASCVTYEYSKNGWALVMPPENSFLSDPSTVQDSIEN